LQIHAVAGLFPRKRLSGNNDRRREYTAVIGMRIILAWDLPNSSGKKTPRERGRQTGEGLSDKLGWLE
jgi:hypothetical protein